MEIAFCMQHISLRPIRLQIKNQSAADASVYGRVSPVHTDFFPYPLFRQAEEYEKRTLLRRNGSQVQRDCSESVQRIPRSISSCFHYPAV